MKKVFGLTLMVAVVISLIGCGQNKAATTTETTTTEVVTEATTKEATTTEAPTTEATVTETVTTEASTNNADKASEELKENVIKTEGIDFKAIYEEVENGTSKRIVFAFVCDKGDVGPVFEADIADEGSDTVEITLDSREALSAVVTGDVVDIEGDALHDSKLEGFTLFPLDRETEKSFSIKYSDGKVVNFIIHFPES